MQLNTSRPMRQAVRAITASLLGAGLACAADQNQAETSILIYSEKDRVAAAEGILGINKQLRHDFTIDLKLTYDGLTGATPNGAVPSRNIQTFTRPSGQGSYAVRPGATPLDHSFKDTRFAVDASLSKPINRLTTVTFGTHLSKEHDYSSLGLNAGITRDLNQKNTTIGISGSYSHDVVSPVGSTPTPFATMQAPQPPVTEEEGHGHGSGRPKEVYDIVFGISQILDRKTIARFNYSFDHSSGYLNDPYKLLSVVEDSSSANAGDPAEYFYEKRPEKSSKNALYGQIRHFLSGSSIDVSYRYFWNDWGIKSHTVDLFYRWQLGAGKALQPHLRFYHQSQADFYRSFLIQGNTLPQFASADARLAAFNAYTFGLQYSFPINNVSSLGVTAEYYTQRGDSGPPNAFGSLRSLDLFPKLNAFMIRVGFTRGL
jgi:hypothetical protein